MLLEFKVGNYLSFKEPVTFSMVASSSKKEHEENVFEANDKDKIRLLKSAVIYGANASGKSNLLKAMNFARYFVIMSSKESQITEPIDVEIFRLSTETENQPSFFEFAFLLEGTIYRYGFETDRTEIHREWLFYTLKNKEVKLFERKKNDFDISPKFQEGEGVKDKTRNNALFLSVVAQFNGNLSTNILGWFGRYKSISGLRDSYYLGYTMARAEKESFRSKIMEFLKCADVGIENFDLEQEEIASSREIKSLIPIGSVKTIHKKFNKENISVSSEIFDLLSSESEGTKKLFAMSGPLIDVLEKGKVLVIDEFDSRLHPLLTQFIIKLFNSKINNPNNAQLIFASHDTSYLNKDFFRRDQIWFTEKSPYGATDLYSLVEYRKEKEQGEEKGKVRKDASFSKDYFLGKYGAIPYIKEIKTLMDSDGNKTLTDNHE
ncbi:MAG: ATP-binding protein [bacterium]|nr:ATP-binding protein [bacterium]